MESSNIDRVVAGLGHWLDGFNFVDRPGLGEEVVGTILRGPDSGQYGGIMGRIAQGVTPDGQEWPENSAEYAAEKRKEYGWSEVNRRVGQMVSLESLRGRTRIEARRIEMVYGTGNPPGTSKAPTGRLSDQDKAVTDVQKAQWATAAGRGFYGWNEDDRRNVIRVCQEDLDEHIKDYNR